MSKKKKYYKLYSCTHDCVFCYAIMKEEDNKFRGKCGNGKSPEYNEKVSEDFSCEHINIFE